MTRRSQSRAPQAATARTFFGPGIASIALSLALVACASTAPTPAVSESPAVEQTPTPTPTAEPVAAPFPDIDISCEDFALEGAISDALGAEATPTNSMPSLDGADIRGPRTFAVVYAGGLDCAWTTGDDFVSLSTLSNPGKLWDKMGDYYSPSSATQRQCSNRTNCMADPLTENDVWISLSLSRTSGDTSPEKWNTIVDSAIATVTSASSVPDQWEPQSAFPITSECESLITNEQAQTAFDSAVPLTGYSPGGGWSIEASAMRTIDGYICIFATPTSDGGPGIIEAIEGGEWAWQQTATFANASDRTELHLEGLAATDSAWLSCSEDSVGCSGDLLIGGNWVKASVDTEAAEASVKRLLQTIADNLSKS